jgi:septum formation protein
MSDRVVLASKSPRRRVLLGLLMDSFTVAPADADETAPLALPVPLAVQAIARKKALAVSNSQPDAWVLAADTVVVREGRLIGKARNELQERMTLADLSGNTHEVVTGLALAWNGDTVDDDVAIATVRMARLDRGTVDAYVASGQWQGKAGGYGIQDALLQPYIHLETGSWSTVVGLPLGVTYDLLRRNDVPCKAPPDEAWLHAHNPFAE